jgi:LysM repeat protein
MASSVKVKSGDTLSQIAKSKGITLKSLLAANPNIKNANMIRVGQSIRIPGAEAGKASKSSNPYKGMTKTQMNMMDVKNKDRGKQEAATRSLIAQSKMGTGMTPSKPAPKTDAQKAMDRARAKMKNAPKKSAPKKNSQSMSGLRDDDVAAKKGGYMKKYQSGGKTSSEADRLAKLARVKKPKRKPRSMANDVTTGLGRTRAEMEAVARGGAKGMKNGGTCRGGGAATRGKKFGRSA